MIPPALLDVVVIQAVEAGAKASLGMQSGPGQMTSQAKKLQYNLDRPCPGHNSKGGCTKQQPACPHGTHGTIVLSALITSIVCGGEKSW